MKKSLLLFLTIISFIFADENELSNNFLKWKEDEKEFELSNEYLTYPTEKQKEQKNYILNETYKIVNLQQKIDENKLKNEWIRERIYRRPRYYYSRKYYPYYYYDYMYYE